MNSHVRIRGCGLRRVGAVDACAPPTGRRPPSRPASTTASGSKRQASSTLGKVGAGACDPCARTRRRQGGDEREGEREGRAAHRDHCRRESFGNRRADRGVHAAMKRTAPGLFVVLSVILAACAAAGGSPRASETDARRLHAAERLGRRWRDQRRNRASHRCRRADPGRRGGRRLRDAADDRDPRADASPCSATGA